MRAGGGRATSRPVAHVGEWRVAIRAESLEAVFIEVARVIARAISGRRGRARDLERVTLEAPDVIALLVNWANELIGRCEADAIDCTEVARILINDGPSGWQLTADVRFRAVRGWRSPLKAATHHGARCEPDPPGWVADILFDV